MSSTLRVLVSLLSLATLSCAKPQSVALGGACKEQVECKAPADTCMTLNGEMLCTVACSAESACPTGHVCAKMDVRVEGDDGAGQGGEKGYCLAQSRVASHVVTIAPDREGKKVEKSRADK